MKTFPILYSLYELVEGNGFVARIELNGTALATEEEPGEWWAYGINPGAIAASGETIREAFASLQVSFRAYLQDCAAEASGFEEFKAELERFFHETGPESHREWDEAVRAVRAGAAIPSNLDKQSLDSSPRGIRVSEVGPTPSPVQGGVDADGGVKVAA